MARGDGLELGVKAVVMMTLLLARNSNEEIIDFIFEGGVVRRSWFF